MRYVARLFLLALAAGSVGCKSPAQPGSQRVIGVIDNGSTGGSPLGAPDTVAVGVPFVATVMTFGSACDKPDGTDVQTTGSIADVTPYILLPPPGTLCIALLVARSREVLLTFAVPGTGVIRLHGRRFGPGDLTVIRTVVVKP